jgi:hypothetical protein
MLISFFFFASSMVVSITMSADARPTPWSDRRVSK